MQIGVVSDTHNNLKNIDTIISLFNKENVDLVIHTGDVTNANSLEKFSRLKCKLIGVYGNNDRNEKGLQEVALKYNFLFQEPPNSINLRNRNIAIFHEPDIIDDFLLNKDDIDIVIHGHTHRYRHELKNNTLFFNPGESAGMLAGSNAIGIVDLTSMTAKRIFF
jgi:putative phosphoesterase